MDLNKKKNDTPQINDLIQQQIRTTIQQNLPQTNSSVNDNPLPPNLVNENPLPPNPLVDENPLPPNPLVNDNIQNPQAILQQASN